jgi:hypothetical protein
MPETMTPAGGNASRPEDYATILATWGPRAETPIDIAPKFRATLERLSTIESALSGWSVNFTESFKSCPTAELDEADFVQAIEEGVTELPSGAPDPSRGYSFSANTHPECEARNFEFRGSAGAWSVARHLINRLTLTSQPLCDDNASLLTLDVLKPALRVLASVWRPTWCQLASGRLSLVEHERLLQVRRPFFGRAWVAYLSPRFVQMVTPPAAGTTEILPDGGLLMTATDDWFDIDNPRHMAAATAISDAMAPVNALPWPPDE